MFSSNEYLVEFWKCVQEWYLSTYGFSKPLVAAINGHAPAGGCAMALMADYRLVSIKQICLCGRYNFWSGVLGKPTLVAHCLL